MGNYFSFKKNELAEDNDLARQVKRQSKKADAEKHDNFKDLPFWFGYLPDNDVKEVLNYRNEFLLRRLEIDDTLCLTICLCKNRIYDVFIQEEDTGWRLQGQNQRKLTIKNLIEFYWVSFVYVTIYQFQCTKWSINRSELKFRLDAPVLRPEWLLTTANIKFGNVLGEGSYGVVIHGLLLDVHMDCAIKQIKVLPDNDDELCNLWREARTMRGLRNKYIVSFLGIINDEKPFSMVIEYVNGDSVDKYLEDNRELDNEFRMKILIDASKGMKYLHSQHPPFLHLDLAARNLLMQWEGVLKRQRDVVIKVADFGLSRRAKKDFFDREKPANIRWLDPYTFQNEVVDKNTDVWAFGITIFECFVRPFQIPYAKWSAQQVHDEVLMAERGKRKRLDRPNGMPVQIFELMKACMYLDEKRNNRPTFENLQDALQREYKLLS